MQTYHEMSANSTSTTKQYDEGCSGGCVLPADRLSVTDADAVCAAAAAAADAKLTSSAHCRPASSALVSLFQ